MCYDKKILFGLLGLIIFISGCATTGRGSMTQPIQSQTQITEFQTCTYDTTDTRMVMKAVLNAFQDYGYIIKNVNGELGIITATKSVTPFSAESKYKQFLATFLSDLVGTWEWIIEANANISEFGPQTRVRVIFYVKVLDKRGSVFHSYQVQDVKYYQEFFSKVDKNIFIESDKNK